MPASERTEVTVAERIESACSRGWLGRTQIIDRVATSEGGFTAAMKHLIRVGRVEERTDPEYGRRKQYRKIFKDDDAAARAALMGVVEEWGQQRRINVKELLFRMRTKKLR